MQLCYVMFCFVVVGVVVHFSRCFLVSFRFVFFSSDFFLGNRHLGEMYTSSAPYDPLFWVIHPTAERFLGWRRILGKEGIDG